MTRFGFTTEAGDIEVKDLQAQWSTRDGNTGYTYGWHVFSDADPDGDQVVYNIGDGPIAEKYTKLFAASPQLLCTMITVVQELEIIRSILEDGMTDSRDKLDRTHEAIDSLIGEMYKDINGVGA